MSKLTESPKVENEPSEFDHERFSSVMDSCDRYLSILEKGLATSLNLAEIADNMKKWELHQLADAQRTLQAMDERTKALKAYFYKAFDFVRTGALVEKLDELGIEGSVKVEDVGRVNQLADLHVSVPAASKAKFFDWLDDNGLGDLIQPAVNSSSLKASMKRRLQAGDEMPPEELLIIKPFTKCSITKG